ncbi:MAG: polyphosphate polymerase domain-containing protein [Planctomycetes bacterium]|nr:polyphosphate polymerase domain-containing protein [Planctomycetota bacterium]
MTYRNRFECKFVVPESTAAAVFRRVQPFVAPDPYGADRPDHSYTIASLYLDSPTLRLYHETVDGQSERFKLRVRTYDDDPKTPLFLEVKRRHDRVVQKLRCPIPRHLLPAVLAGEPVDLPGSSPTKQRSLAEFQRLMLLARAIPRTTVKYQRQAYVGLDDPEVRVTGDRRLCAVTETAPRVRVHDPDYRTVPTHGVVLELKFTDRMPPWMADAIRALDLRRRSFSKYCTSVDALNDRPTAARLQT